MLKQPQYQPLPVEKQVAIIWVVTNGYLDDVPTPAQSRDFEQRFYRFLEIGAARTLLKTIGGEAELTDEIVTATCADATEAFKQTVPGLDRAVPTNAQPARDPAPHRDRSATSSRSPGRCSWWPRRSCGVPRTRRSRRGPYAEKMRRGLAELAAGASGADDHPLLAQREGGTRLHRAAHHATAAWPARSTPT